MPMHNFIGVSELKVLGVCVPMQNVIRCAQSKALGLCPSRILSVSHN